MMIWRIRRQREERRIRKRVLHNEQVKASRSGDQSPVDALSPEVEGRLQEYLEARESYNLMRMAERWGIDIPPKPEWFTMNIHKNEPKLAALFGIPEVAIHRNLNETGRTMIFRQVRAARLAYWKGWVDLLIPILALLVAALALFKDIIVEVSKK